MGKDKTKALMKQMKKQQSAKNNQLKKQAWDTLKRSKGKGKLPMPKPGDNPELIYLTHKEITEQTLLEPKFTRADVQQDNLKSLRSFKDTHVTAVGLVTNIEFVSEDLTYLVLERPQIAELANPAAKQEKTNPLDKDIRISLSQITESDVDPLFISIGDLFLFNATVEEIDDQFEFCNIHVLASGFLHKETDEQNKPIITSDYPHHDEWIVHWSNTTKRITTQDPEGWVKELLDKKATMDKKRNESVF